MAPWIPNAVGLAIAATWCWFLALALLWRIGSWHIHPAATLTYDEGLSAATKAPEIACHTETGAARHLSFVGTTALVVFGARGCKPCDMLLTASLAHPATSYMRLVYIADAGVADLDPAVLARWETYVFHDEEAARRQWRAPVSPYFHVVDAHGRVLDKGVASLPAHLDRLLRFRPGELAINLPVHYERELASRVEESAS